MASAVGVRLIMEHPVKTIETIFRGTDVVLGFCSRYRKRVLVPSTSEVYGKGISVPFKEEDDLLTGSTDKHRWAYACAKTLDEFLGFRALERNSSSGRCRSTYLTPSDRAKPDNTEWLCRIS